MSEICIHPVYFAVIGAVRASLRDDNFRQFSTFSDQAKADFRKVCKLHAVSALASLSVDDDVLKDKYNSTLYKNLQYDDELRKFEEYCESKQIWYCPMKGTALECLYPAYGTREMTDRDILFDESRREDVREYFTGAGYKVEAYGATNHDVYHKDPMFSFELHVALFRGEDVQSFADYYKDAYPRLVKHQCQGGATSKDLDVCPCGREILMKCDLSASDFYVFNLAHIIKHYVEGGIQIKSLVDIYVMLTKLEGLDWAYIEAEETKLGTLELERVLRSLATKLFGDAPSNGAEQGTSDFASAGTEQSMDSKITVGTCEITLTSEETKVLEVVTLYGQFATDLALLQRQIAKKSRARVLLESAFPGKAYMTQKYPRAGKCVLFYPILWIIRIVSIIASPRKRALARQTTDNIANQSKLSDLDRLRLSTITNNKLL